MTYICLFLINPDLRAELMATGELTLVEASPTDGVWGVKRGLNDPLLLDPTNWRGTNLLGVALMTVRGLLRHSTPQEADPSKRVI